MWAKCGFSLLQQMVRILTVWVSGGSFTKSETCTFVYENVSSNTLHRIVTAIRYVLTTAGVFNVWVRSSIYYAIQDAM